MIGALKAKVLTPDRNPAVMMAGNVGYLVFMPPKLLQKLKSDKEELIYIYTHVREDAFDLYGFSTPEEYDLFCLLVSVSGIGPKTAILVIDKGVSSVQKAIATSDTEFFTSVPRLGTKNAQKIIIELKSKLGSVKDLDLSGYEGSETKDIIDALSSMGFARSEIIDALKKMDKPDAPMADKVRILLKILGK